MYDSHWRRWFICFLLIAPAQTFAQQEEQEDIPLEKMSGKQIYTFYCARCHAEDGTGNIDPEMIAEMEAPPPDLTEPYFSSREKRKDWQAVVAHGGGARGLSMSMPAWNEALTDSQIIETVEYMKLFVDQSLYPQGELNFFRGHTTTKAFVEQEALLLPSYQYRTVGGVTTRQSKTVAYYANRFGARFQYEAKLPLQSLHTAGRSTFGIGDLEVGVKHAFYDNHRSLTILTVGLEGALPIGAKEFSAGTVVAVPYFAVGQGIGSHAQLSATVKVETPLDQSKGEPELRVSFLSMLTLPEAKQGVFPGIEFFARKNLSHSEYALSMIPQLYWGITARGHLALSLGTEIPLAGTRTFDRRIVAFFLWDFVDGGLWW